MKKHWYHISDTWNTPLLTVYPRRGRTDSDDVRDTKEFIAVAPTIEQCLVAVGMWQDYDKLRIYKTQKKTEAMPANWVFDYEITNEHRIYHPTIFVFVEETTPDQLIQQGVLDLSLVGDDASVIENGKRIIESFSTYNKKVE